MFPTKILQYRKLEIERILIATLKHKFQNNRQLIYFILHVLLLFKLLKINHLYFKTHNNETDPTKHFHHFQ
jgi:hypothetical protein